MTAQDLTPLRIGLTGGIGSGKSTVADLLVARGAAVVDADVIARDVVAPGGPAYDAVVARFGREVCSRDGTLDRAALATRVFSDPAALADLNAITHPVIGMAMVERLSVLDDLPTDGRPEVAVAVVPLLRQAHVDALGLRAVVVVDCPTDVAVGRLVEGRGMDEADARARVAAQPSREERLALADYVVDNGSTPEALALAVGALWGRLRDLRDRRRG
ncbi:MAG TPA: dephospho-CoA kinase [Acidimicrobiales bacterium]|nr:dephospho-CoA kinase [Acidimicrobiales bacterium]